MTIPRTIIVRTSGWVTLEDPIRLKSANSHFTLTGHLAPGDGFGVRLGAGATQTGGMIYSSDDPVSNLIIRYMRFRMGYDGGSVNEPMFLGLMDGPGVTNGIISNCSFSWGRDETLSVQYADRFTVQDCIIAEGIEDGNGFSEGVTTVHNFGGLYSGKLTLARNLFMHNYSRCPHVRGEVDVRNNVAFNTHHAVHSSGGSFAPREINVVGNYFVIGPALINNYPTTSLEQQIHYSSDVRMHFSGNLAQGYPASTNNNMLIVNGMGSKVNYPEFKRPFVTPRTAVEAFAYVKLHVGATLPVRDSVDARLIAELEGQAVSSATWDGWITHENQVGGFPRLAANGESSYVDTDNDGMDDEWELRYFGTMNRDGTGDYSGSGYTDLEEFLWGTDPTRYLNYYTDMTTGPVAGERPLPPRDLGGLAGD
jgi:hypothetical protein